MSFLTTFSAGDSGPWQISRCDPVCGDGLASAPHFAISPASDMAAKPNGGWQLTAFASNIRYVERAEKTALSEHSTG